MTAAFYFWSAFTLFLTFLLGVASGSFLMRWAIQMAMRETVALRGFIEINGVRFIAVVTKPSLKG